MLTIRLVFLSIFISLGMFAEAKSVLKPKKILPKKLQSNFSSAYIEDAIKSAAKTAGVPHQLLKAICRVESNLNPSAFVFNDGGKETSNHAYGLCQVLRETAADLIGADKGCYTDFRNRPQDRTFKNCNLFGPKTNALAAAKYLRKQIDRYGNLVAATAAYNSGSLKLCRKGLVSCSETGITFRCTPGKLLNGYYVDRVDNFLEQTTFSQLAECHPVAPIAGGDILKADFVRALKVYTTAEVKSRTAS